VHAELVHGNGISVGHNTVQPLMSRAGLAGLPTRRRGKRSQPAPETVSDLVKRQFGRDGPNQLWVTDIERHEAFANPGGGGRPSRDACRSRCLEAGGRSTASAWGWSVEQSSTTTSRSRTARWGGLG